MVRLRDFRPRAAVAVLLGRCRCAAAADFVGAAASSSPVTVPLGTTAGFAILAGSGISDVPTSTISGDVGLSPATGAAITGLTCAEVTGTTTRSTRPAPAVASRTPACSTTAAPTRRRRR